MIKIKNKSINKQTNKQTNEHFLDPKYLSQIKFDLHEALRKTSCGCPAMIKTTKPNKSQNKTNKSVNKQTNK